MTAVTAPPPGPSPEPQARPWHTVSLEELFALQEVNEHQGLTTEEAADRRAEHGPNRMVFTAAVAFATPTERDARLRGDKSLEKHPCRTDRRGSSR
jgi:Cation transporter/ATPase, N-terminus